VRLLVLLPELKYLLNARKWKVLSVKDSSLLNEIRESLEVIWQFRKITSSWNPYTQKIYLKSFVV
jgi:hypothetical protein